MLLAAAVAVRSQEADVLRLYRSASGTKKIVDAVVQNVRGTQQQALRDAFGVISWWRNEAAHGEATPAGEIEAHEALGRLLRLAQLVSAIWSDLVA